MLQARVRELWKARHRHRSPRLVYHQDRSPTALPLQDMRGNAQHEYGDGVQRSSLHSEGVRPSSGHASRGREHFCHGPSHRSFPQHRRTVAQRASRAAELFNRRMLRDFDIVELQADELYTFIGGKSRPMWLFATIEVCSRLWASSLVGRRSYRNTKAVLNDIILRGRLVGIPLIATDGLLRGDRSPHGSRLRLRSSDQDSAEQSCRPSRTARQDRHDESLGVSTVGVGGFREPERAHTSFVERLNLTIRQGSAYLRRRSPCHARCTDRLRWHVELLRCHYTFVRPHSALKFGRETRTPAMQAGLVSTRMNWNDIFTAHGLSLRIFATVVRIPVPVQLIETGVAELPTFSWPHDQRKAA